MPHLYDSSSYSLKSQQIRLKAACVLSKVHIKCLVWGEDALAFIHFVPANLNTLHLVVVDQHLHLASTEILKIIALSSFYWHQSELCRTHLVGPKPVKELP